MTGGLQRASVAYIRGRRRRGQEEKQAAVLLIGPHQGQGKEQVPQCQNAAQSCPRWNHDPGPRTEPKPPLTQRAAQPAPSVQRPPVSSLLRRHSKFHSHSKQSGCYCTDEVSLLFLPRLCTFGKLVSSSGFSMAESNCWNYHRLQLRTSPCGHFVCFPSTMRIVGAMNTTPGWDFIASEAPGTNPPC